MDNGKAQAKTQSLMAALATKRKSGLQQELDAVLDELELQDHAEQWLTEMMDAIRAGENDPALLEKVAQQWPGLDESALQEQLTRVLFVAQMLGRLEADAETTD